MKNLTNQFIACLLLLCFTVTIVPLNLIHEYSHGHNHSHSEKKHCDINDNIHSDDACHFSLYHNELAEKHCEHQAHFTDYEFECEICKMLNSQRDNFVHLKEKNKQAQAYYSLLVALNFEHHQQSFSDLVFNKGSPVIG